MLQSVSTRRNISTTSHKIFMSLALKQAELGLGYTSPNPAVGAVVVKNGRIVGAGYHRQAGAPHAEVEALRQAGTLARGGTMYVTLEPCNHHGRTPPCTEAIIQAGIKTVYYATIDPNPNVTGCGHQQLVAAGVEVHQGPLSDAAYELNRFFMHYVAEKRPYLIAKFASSLDGKIATHTGVSQWITGAEARQKGHYLRHICDAILIGAGTAIADDPRLTTRLATNKSPSHPTRILLDSRGRVPLSSRLFAQTLPGQTIVATTSQMNTAHRRSLEKQGVEIIELPCSDTNQVDLHALMTVLGQRKIMSILIEGGGQVLASFFKDKLINEVWSFVAPIIIGGESAPSPVRGRGATTLDDAFYLQNHQIEQLGQDILIRGYLPKQTHSMSFPHKQISTTSA